MRRKGKVVIKKIHFINLLKLFVTYILIHKNEGNVVCIFIRLKLHFHAHTNAPLLVSVSILNIIKIFKPRGRRGFSDVCIRPLTCKSNGFHLHRKDTNGLIVALSRKAFLSQNIKENLKNETKKKGVKKKEKKKNVERRKKIIEKKEI